MKRFLRMAALGAALTAMPAQASWLFPKGVGNYGPYTGGHGYSYATAYHYGFTWSAADSWKRDIFAYPAGISPYRPNGKPISCTVFPHPDTPYIAVPGPDGLPTLVKPPMQPVEKMLPAPLAPAGTPLLNPVPANLPQPATAPAGATNTTATIKIQAPATAEVWVEKEKVGPDRVFQTAALQAGKVQVISVRARWNEGGRDVEQFRVVGVRPGETAKVTFGQAAP